MLASYLKATAGTPFQWGRCDCLLWAAGGVQSVTGIDPAHRFRGIYYDARGAVRLIRNAGGMETLMANALDPLLRRDPLASEGVGLVRIARRDVGALVSAGRLWVKGDGVVLTGEFLPDPLWGF